MDIREKLVELMIEAKKAATEDSPFSEFLADFMIAHGVTVREEGYWINIPPYRAISGDYNKAQECPKCHAFFVSNGNEPYSNHPYCCECGARLSPTPPKGE